MCVPSSAIVGIGVAGVGEITTVGEIAAVGVAVGISGATVAVGGKNVAEGEIDGFGVLVAVAVTVAVTVTTTGVGMGGGAPHCPNANSPAATSPRPIRIIRV